MGSSSGCGTPAFGAARIPNVNGDEAREAARDRLTGRFGEQPKTDPGVAVLAGDSDAGSFLAPGDDGQYVFTPGLMGEWDYRPSTGDELVRVAAAGEVYRQLEQPEVIQAKLTDLARRHGQARLLIDRRNRLQAKECRILSVQPGPGWSTVTVRAKGSNTGSETLLLDHVLAVEPGYGSLRPFSVTFARRPAQFIPRTTYADPRQDLPGGATDLVQAVYMLGARNDAGWAGTRPGSLFLATGRNENVVEGYLWDADGHGFALFAPTFYANDMKGATGRLVDYQPGTVNVHNLDDMPDDLVEAYRFVMGASFQPKQV